MPKYDVWFTARGIGGRVSLKETVTAKNKDEAWAIVRRTWYGENPEKMQVKGHKTKTR
jgi:hypothetical protein